MYVCIYTKNRLSLAAVQKVLGELFPCSTSWHSRHILHNADTLRNFYILKHVYLQCLVLRCRILGLQFLSLDLTLSSAPEFTICHPFLSAYLLLLSLSLSLSLSLISSLLLLLLLLTYKIIRDPRNLIQASPQYSDVSPKLIHRVRSITDGIKLYFDQGHDTLRLN